MRYGYQKKKKKRRLQLEGILPDEEIVWEDLIQSFSSNMMITTKVLH